jgi:hypothetical protein
MKKIILFTSLLLSSCGYSSVDNEGTGQVKKISHETPIFCPNYNVADIAIGSIQSGAISITHDWYVINSEDEKILKEAAEKGKLIKFTYNVERVAFCTGTNHFLESVEIIN